MIWSYLKRSKEVHEKTSRASKQFSKVAGHKTNIQNSIAFLYKNSESVVREKKTKQNSFIENPLKKGK